MRNSRASSLDERAFFRDSKAEELAFWQEKLTLTEAGSRARFAVEANIYQFEKQLAVQSERDALSMLDADEKVSDAVYARKKAAIQANAELGKISAKRGTRPAARPARDKMGSRSGLFRKEAGGGRERYSHSAKVDRTRSGSPTRSF